VGQDGSTISSSKNPSFSSGGTNNAGHLILTSSNYFQSAVVPGGRNSNPPPSAIPARYMQTKTGNTILMKFVLWKTVFRFLGFSFGERSAGVSFHHCGKGIFELLSPALFAP